MESLRRRQHNVIIRKASSICGIALFILSAGFGLYLLTNVINTIKLNRVLSSKIIRKYHHGGKPICKFSQVPIPSVMTINESLSLEMVLSNIDSNKECYNKISIITVDFDIAPKETNENVTISAGQMATVRWILKPKQLGKALIGIDESSSKYLLAISIVNTFGLNVWQAQILSLIGTFLGPVMTAPWWIEHLIGWWKKRKDKGATTT